MQDIPEVSGIVVSGHGRIVKHIMSMGVIYDAIQHHYISMHDSHMSSILLVYETCKKYMGDKFP